MKDIPYMDGDVSVNIKKIKNGYVISYYKSKKDGPGEDMTYAYDTLDEAMEELPGILSVAIEEKKDKKE